MYERNAIVLERYFNQMFGYNMKSNIKTNFKDYCDLVESLEQYREISDDEENIMQEYDSIANKIREIQKKEEVLNKKIEKYQIERNEIFQTIDENSEKIQKRFDNVHSSIEELNEQVKQNAQDFINVVIEFNEKSKIRTNCGKSRRTIENEYNQRLNKILDDYKEIDINIEKRAKQFVDLETEEIENELKEKIQKNGQNEKIPFDMDVIKKAITLNVDIQKRETEILTGIYEKTNKLFTEIKNNTTKGEKHKKIIKDAKCKLEFVGALKEYLIQFLDNERLTSVNGEEEHKKLMKEACKNLDEDLVQINNLYTLLLKEITKKVTKKSYAELYNVDYLKKLEMKSEQFDNEIKKLNLPVTIINPNYWRIEGMKKIYDVFYKNVTEEYGRDLSQYMPVEEKEELQQEDDDDDWDDDFEEEILPKATKEKDNNKEKETNTKSKRKIKSISNKEDDVKAEIDKKIDMILGFDTDEDEDEDEDYEQSNNSDEDDDEISYDIWGNDPKRGEENYWDGDDDDYEDEEDEYEDDDDEYEEHDANDEEEDEVDSIWDEEDDDDTQVEEEDDEWDDEWDKIDEEELEAKDNKKTKGRKNKKTENKNTNNDNSWENEFVKIDNKDKSKKKKSFFDKFKK